MHLLFIVFFNFLICLKMISEVMLLGLDKRTFNMGVSYFNRFCLKNVKKSNCE